MITGQQIDLSCRVIVCLHIGSAAAADGYWGLYAIIATQRPQFQQVSLNSFVVIGRRRRVVSPRPRPRCLTIRHIIA